MKGLILGIVIWLSLSVAFAWAFGFGLTIRRKINLRRMRKGDHYQETLNGWIVYVLPLVVLFITINILYRL